MREYLEERRTLTDMNYMPIAINHDVAIMSVFYLQNITCYRISSHGLNEVESGFLESYGIFSAVFISEEPKEIVNLRPSHLVPRSSIGDNVDDAALYNKLESASIIELVSQLTPGPVAVTR